MSKQELCGLRNRQEGDTKFETAMVVEMVSGKVKQTLAHPGKGNQQKYPQEGEQTQCAEKYKRSEQLQ